MVEPPAAPPMVEEQQPAPWAAILKKPQQPQQQQQVNPFPTQQQTGVLVGSCNSSKGIAVAVVDANAIISGGERLTHSADRFVTVDEVLAEIRDPASRHSLNFLPFSVDTLEPSPQSLKKGTNFTSFDENRVSS